MISSWFETTNRYINYRIECEENSTNKITNSSNVTVKVYAIRTNTGYQTYGSGACYCTINGVDYSQEITSSQVITENGVYLFSLTVDIAHDNDGHKALVTSAKIDHSRFTTDTHCASFALSKIPRSSSIAVASSSSAILGSDSTLQITREDASFFDEITWQCGSSTGTVTSITQNTSVTINLPVSLSSNNPIGEDVPVTFNIATYSDQLKTSSMGTNTVVISYKVPSSVVPTVSITITDSTTSYEEFGVFLQSKSKLTVTATASGAYSSTISSYNTTVEGKSYTTNPCTTSEIDGSGSLSVTTTVRDSRGRTASVTQTVTVVPYHLPKVTALSAVRCNSDGTPYYRGEYCKVTFSASITSISSQNDAIYYVKYKEVSASSYSTESITISSGYNKYDLTDYTHVFQLNNAKSYNMYLYAEDSFDESRMYVFSPSTSRLMHFSSDGKTCAFLKECESDRSGGADFGGPIYLSNGYMPGGISVEDNDLDNLIVPGFYTTNQSLYHSPFTSTGYNVEVSHLDKNTSGYCIEQKAQKMSGEVATTKVRYRTYSSTSGNSWSSWVDSFDNDVLNHVSSTINALKSALFDIIYPVGAIYISTVSTSPADLFGIGTWSAIHGKFLLAEDGGTYPAGTPGGSATGTYQLTVAAHSHGINGSSQWYPNYSQSAVTYGILNTTTTDGGIDETIEIDTMPPYLPVYVWERTA